ncbi:MAG: isocitrate lyase/PEP mutase family protein [Spirochaetia bacterium]
MNTKQTELKRLLNSERPLVVPDAYDMLSARLIQAAGFRAVQCSGYSFSLNNLYKNERALSFQKNLEITEGIVRAVDLPVMADGEDGYAAGEEFLANIRRFMQTGIAGINIEDQNLWGKANAEKIVQVNVMIEKISMVRALRKSRDIPDFIVNARTDALGAFSDRKKSIKVAIQRANSYLEAGADLCFVTKIKTKQELKLFTAEVNGPLSVAAGLEYNIQEFDINDCRELGIARVSLPSLLLFSTLNTLRKNLEHIKQDGGFAEILKEDGVLTDTAYLRQILEP